MYVLHVQERLAHAYNDTISELVKDFGERMDSILGELKALEPFPVYKPREEVAFVNEMKPKFKKLAGLNDRLEVVLSEVKQMSADMRLEPSQILPTHDLAQSEVKKVLTLCCTNTAAKILSSKAASNCSGNLGQSVDKTLEFAVSNGLSLPKEILTGLKSCQTRLKEAAAASKQKAGVISKPQ